MLEKKSFKILRPDFHIQRLYFSDNHHESRYLHTNLYTDRTKKL